MFNLNRNEGIPSFQFLKHRDEGEKILDEVSEIHGFDE